jgi:Tfp pilus assembly protein PilX
MKNKIGSRSNRCAPKHVVQRQSGIALPMALICLLVISALAAGMMIITQSEIWTNGNYRSTTQARYVAEAGAQQTLNWLQTNWTPPSSDFLNTKKFRLDLFPVQFADSNGNPIGPVIMATDGMTGISDTYAAYDSNKDGSFKTTLGNISAPFAAMSGNPKFNTAAQLLSAVQDSNNNWYTTWKIFSQGTTTNGKVQVIEVVRNLPSTSSSGPPPAPPFDYAVLATGTGCGTIAMSGGQYTNAYNSQTSLGNTNPPFVGTGGDVATFGNVSLTNGAYVNGNVYTPYSNLGAVGTYGISGGPIWPGLNAPKIVSGKKTTYGTPPACSSPSGMWAVNEDNSGSQVGCTNQSTCSQKTYALPPDLATPSSLPDPVLPSVPTNTSACSGYNGLCNGGNGGAAGCAITIPPSLQMDGKTSGGGAANFGKANFGSCSVITLQSGIYNFDTLYISNGGKIIVPSNGPVVINIYNASGSTMPLNVDGGTVANNGGDPINLTYIYGGNQTVNLAAGSNMFATIYAPHAKVTVSGNAGLYGAVVGNTVTFAGSGHVIYDLSLKNRTPNVPVSGAPPPSVGALHVDQFSWSAY